MKGADQGRGVLVTKSLAEKSNWEMIELGMEDGG